MYYAFKKKPAHYDDPITSNPLWEKAVKRAAGLSSGQLDAWFIAVAANAIRQREQWVTSVNPEDDLAEMGVTVISLEAIRRENLRRLERIREN